MSIRLNLYMHLQEYRSKHIIYKLEYENWTVYIYIELVTWYICRCNTKFTSAPLLFLGGY